MIEASRNAPAHLFCFCLFFFNSNKIKQENGKKNTKQSFFFRSSFPISISSAPEARRVGGAELSKWTAKIKKNEEKKVPFFDFRVVERRDEAFHTGGPNQNGASSSKGTKKSGQGKNQMEMKEFPHSSNSTSIISSLSLSLWGTERCLSLELVLDSRESSPNPFQIVGNPSTPGQTQ